MSSDIGVHGLAYLGVLLLFAGTLGLVVFAFASVNPLIRPVAEAAVPLVLLGSAAFLRGRGAPLAAASLELLGGLLLPVALLASLMDGAPFPPDPGPGTVLLLTLALGCLSLAVVYALVAGRRPSTPLAYLAAPLAWAAVGVLGFGFEGRLSVGQFAAVTIAIVASTLLPARGRRARALARPTALAALPAGFVVLMLALLLATLRQGPAWHALLTTAAGVSLAESLASRLGGGRAGTARQVVLAQALVLAAGVAVTTPSLGSGPAGLLAVVGFLCLAEWQAARHSKVDPAVPPFALAGALIGAAAAVLWLGSPWPGLLAAAALSGWSQAHRSGLLPARSCAGWQATVSFVTVAAPLALIPGTLWLLGVSGGRGPAALGLLAFTAAVIARRRRRRGVTWSVINLEAVLAHCHAAVVLACTVVAAALATIVSQEAAGAGSAWALNILAAGLAGAAVALAPGDAASRTIAVAAAATWSVILALQAAGAHALDGGPARASAALALIGLVQAGLATALAVRRPLRAWRLLGVGARKAEGTGPVEDALAAVSLAVATLAIFLGGPLALEPWPAIGALAAGVAGAALLGWALRWAPLPWWAWAQAAVLVILLAGRLGVPGERWQLTLAAWGAAQMVAAVAVDGMVAAKRLGRRAAAGATDPSRAAGAEAPPGRHYRTGAPREWVTTGRLVPPAMLGTASLTLGAILAAGYPRPVLGALWLAAAACYLIVALQLRVGAVSGPAWIFGLAGLSVLWPAGLAGGPAAAIAVPALLALASWVLDPLRAGLARRGPSGSAAAPTARMLLRWDLPPLLLAHAVALVWLARSVPLGWMHVVWPGLGLVSLGVALWRRRWAWALAGDILLAWAPAAHPGWGFAAYAGTAAWKAVAASHTRDLRRRLLQLGCVIAAAVAWLDLVVWAGWPAQIAVAATLLAAGAAGLAVALMVTAGLAGSDGPVRWRGRLVRPDWSAPAGLTALVCSVTAVTVGGAPAGLPGLAASVGVALLALAAWVLALPLGTTWLRMTAAVLATCAGQLVLAAARAPSPTWVVACLVVALLLTAIAVSGWPGKAIASVTGVLHLALAGVATVLFAGAATHSPATDPTVASGSGLAPVVTLLVAAVLAVAAVQAAVLGTVHRLTFARACSPVLTVGAWLALAPALVGGDPLWRTIPTGAALLVAAEIARADGRRAGRAARPELVSLEYTGMALAAGDPLLRVAFEGPGRGLVAILVGLALFGWGLLTRVRRRLVAGVATVLLAAATMVAAPLAKLVAEVRGPVLWLLVAALGTVLLILAMSIERARTGRGRPRSPR